MTEATVKTSCSIPPVVALHKYFIRANKMRTDFDELLKVNGPAKQLDLDICMSYWYAGLYVVIEGWNELKLNDAKIDTLLKMAEFVGLLRRYRNGVFHFQADYFDKRFVDVLSQEKDYVKWIRKLNSELGRFFLEWFKRYDNEHPKAS